MVLKAEISQAEYDGLSDTLQGEYLKKSGEQYREGMFYLDVGPSGGFALEPIDGLKSALSKERQNAENANVKLRAYDGLDPTKARDALKQLEELGDDANSKQKIEALVGDRVKQWKEKNTTDLAAKDQEIRVLMDALEEETIVAKAITALNEHKGNAELLLPHVLGRTRIVRTEDNGKIKFVPRVIDPTSGQDLLSKETGSTDFMRVEELVATMKDNKTFAAGFTDVDASGFGSDRGDDTGMNQAAGKKYVKMSDQDAINSNVEGIADGSVIVVDG